MFTGIIQQIGTVKKILNENQVTTLIVEASPIAATKKIGDSIAVDGTCLTVTAKDETTLSVQAIPETLKLTIIKNYQADTKVNLENPLKIGEELGGHFVSGHVDFVGTVKKIEPQGGSKTIQITFPENYAKYFALKGSATVNGVSLTISNLDEQTFQVSLIPETLQKTNLGELKQNDHVNIEIDLISRYLDSLLQDKAKESTYEFLRERNLI